MNGDRHAPVLVLASASPARLRTLQAAGIDPEVVVSGVDEEAVSADGPAALSATLARLKAEAVAATRKPDPDRAPTLVLGCDSVLELDGQAHGKPAGSRDAARRWRRMRGRSGMLHTGHALVALDTAGQRRAEAVASTKVHFAEITDAEIDAYVATGEPLAVAGAFKIDGIGGAFVEGIEGDPGTVIGLSLPLLRRLLADLDVPITALWRR